MRRTLSKGELGLLSGPAAAASPGSAVVVLPSTHGSSSDDDGGGTHSSAALDNTSTADASVGEVPVVMRALASPPTADADLSEPLSAELDEHVERVLHLVRQSNPPPPPAASAAKAEKASAAPASTATAAAQPLRLLQLPQTRPEAGRTLPVSARLRPPAEMMAADGVPARALPRLRPPAGYTLLKLTPAPAPPRPRGLIIPEQPARPPAAAAPSATAPPPAPGPPAPPVFMTPSTAMAMLAQQQMLMQQLMTPLPPVIESPSDQSAPRRPPTPDMSSWLSLQSAMAAQLRATADPSPEPPRAGVTVGVQTTVERAPTPPAAEPPVVPSAPPPPEPASVVNDAPVAHEAPWAAVARLPPRLPVPPLPAEDPAKARPFLCVLDMVNPPPFDVPTQGIHETFSVLGQPGPPAYVPAKYEPAWPPKPHIVPHAPPAAATPAATPAASLPTSGGPPRISASRVKRKYKERKKERRRRRRKK